MEKIVLSEQTLSALIREIETTLLSRHVFRDGVITGQEILKFAPHKQINNFILFQIYQDWNGHVQNFRHPYFNFDHTEVNDALTSFLNTLSRHIRITEKDFRPMLEKAIYNTLKLILNPMEVFSKFFFLNNDRIPIDLFKKHAPYFSDYDFIIQSILKFYGKNQVPIVEKKVFFEKTERVITIFESRENNSIEKYRKYLFNKATGKDLERMMPAPAPPPEPKPEPKRYGAPTSEPKMELKREEPKPHIKRSEPRQEPRKPTTPPPSSDPTPRAELKKAEPKPTRPSTAPKMELRREAPKPQPPVEPSVSAPAAPISKEPAVSPTQQPPRTETVEPPKEEVRPIYKQVPQKPRSLNERLADQQESKTLADSFSKEKTPSVAAKQVTPPVEPTPPAPVVETSPPVEVAPEPVVKTPEPVAETPQPEETPPVAKLEPTIPPAKPIPPAPIEEEEVKFELGTAKEPEAPAEPTPAEEKPKTINQVEDTSSDAPKSLHQILAERKAAEGKATSLAEQLSQDRGQRNSLVDRFTKQETPETEAPKEETPAAPEVPVVPESKAEVPTPVAEEKESPFSFDMEKKEPVQPTPAPEPEVKSEPEPDAAGIAAEMIFERENPAPPAAEPEPATPDGEPAEQEPQAFDLFSPHPEEEPVSLFSDSSPPTLGQKFQSDQQATPLNERLAPKKSIKIEHIPVHKQFQFVQKLFSGQSVKFRVVLDKLNETKSYVEADEVMEKYIFNSPNTRRTDKLSQEFILLVKNRFEA